MTKKMTLPALPAPLVAADLAAANWKLNGTKNPARSARWATDVPATATHTYGAVGFELWHTTGFGWCIPTLLIRNASRGASTNRTYAVRVSDGSVVRIGFGPHVTARVSVNVRVNRVAALQPLLDLALAGEVNANTIRDRISSRRAAGVARRGFAGGW